MAIGVERHSKTNAGFAPGGALAASITGFFNLLGAAVQRFGWPGVIICWVAWFIVEFGSIEQKRKLIDMYALGHGTPYAVILVSVLFVLVLFAQAGMHSKKVNEITARCNQAESEKDHLYAQLEAANSRLSAVDARKRAK